MNVEDKKFDHDLFDAHFLMNMLDHGVNIKDYPYERIDYALNVVSRKFGEYMFAYTLDMKDDWSEAPWEVLAAKRAAFRVRDRIQTWRDGSELIYLEKVLDRLNDKGT